ncbi:MAG: GNAT family N-acetyltransferase [Cyanobacteria bacterium P01_F01_bin.150]
MANELCPGYEITRGSSLDRASLVKVMQKTYQELHPKQPVTHLVQTVDQYLSSDTPLWWVYIQSPSPIPTLSLSARSSCQTAVGCLWLGDAIDQIEGDRHAYIFLLYVYPKYRRQGIGTALMDKAEQWAMKRGDRKISLQVFTDNYIALSMYHQLDYKPQSLWMTKRLNL